MILRAEVRLVLFFQSLLMFSIPGYAARATPSACIQLLHASDEVRQEEIERAEKLVSKIKRRSFQNSSPMKPGKRRIKKIDFNQSEIMLIFSASTMPKVVKSGFKNVHQVKTTSFSTGSISRYAALRRRLEDAMAGVKIEDDEIRPKYAMLQVYDKNFLKEIEGQGFGAGDDIDGLHNYGDVAAVLEDRVKRRTTYTLFDSLAGLGELSEGELTTGIREELRTFSEGPSSVNFSSDYIDYRYCEAQIWGPLSLQDVKYFIVHTGLRNGLSEENEAELLASRIRNLLPAKKPIYLMQRYDTPLRKIFPFLDSKEEIEHIGYWMKGSQVDAKK